MTDTSPSRFIDQVYEAAIVPEFWPKVLREFAGIADASDGVLLSFREGDSRFVCSSQKLAQVAEEHYAYDGAIERTQRLIALQHAGFATDLDVFTEAEMLSIPVYADYLIPNGYGAGIATSIHVPSGENIIFHCERPFRDGPYSPDTIARLDSLRPHLARAALLSARLGLEKARAAAVALEMVGLPAAVLGPDGRMIATNDLMVAMMPDMVQDRRARVTLSHPGADGLLKSALQLAALSDQSSVRSIPVPASGADGSEHPPVILHLVPIRGAAHDIFAGAGCVLVATPVVPRAVPGASVLQALFDLTPAEAKVAEAIARGETSKGIATSYGTSVTTVRNQVNAVLAKTGLNRQAELVGLLSGRALGPPQSTPG